MDQVKMYKPIIMFLAKAAACCGRILSGLSRKHKSILVVKDDGLGDMIFWVPYGKLLRLKYPFPQYKITMLVNNLSQDLCRAAEISDKVIALPSNRGRWPWLYFRFKFWISNYFDRVLIISAQQNDVVLPYIKKIELFLNRDFTDPRSILSDIIPDKAIDCNNCSIIQRHEKIIKKLEITEKTSEIDFNDFAIPLTELRLPERFFTVAPGASEPRRCWEKEKFALLINKLQEQWNITAIITGSDQEYGLGEIIRSSCCHPDQVINMCGKTSFFELCHIIKRSDFLLSNETGTAHVGPLFKIPVFIICGFGDYGDFIPYPPAVEGKSVHCIFSDNYCSPCGWKDPQCKKKGIYRCISEISVEKVFRIIKKTMQ